MFGQLIGRKARIAKAKAEGERRRRFLGPRHQEERVVDDVKRAAWLARRNSRTQVRRGQVTLAPQFDPARRRPKRSRYVSAAELQVMRDSTRRKRAKADSIRMRAENARNLAGTAAR